MPRDGKKHRIEILKLLQENGSTTLAEIADKVGIQQSTVSRTINNLRKSGHIKAFKIILDPIKFNLVTLAVVRFALKDASPEAMKSTVHIIKTRKYVQEVHRVAGEFDLFVKIRCVSNANIAQFIDAVQAGGNIKDSNTTVLTETYEETSDIFVADD